jgi:glycosyltransferase involved in cell wall biosynthesis
MAEKLERRAPARILYVENGIGYGGAVICLRHLVRNLDRRRFEPIVVTGKSLAPYKSIAQDATWLPIRDRMLDTLGWQRRIGESGLKRSAPRLASRAQKALGWIDDVGNFLPFFVRLLLAILRHRPALIHANNEPMCNRAALIAGRLTGIPVICHVRGNFGQPSRLLRWLYSLPAHFIAVSHWIADGMAPLGVPAQRTTCIYDGIELEKLDRDADGGAFRRRFGISRDAFAVGLIGLLIPWKGQRLFLEAGRMLMERIRNLQLVIVGGTPEVWADYERELRTAAADPAFKGRVVFAGHVSEMAQAYNGLDVVLSASTSPEPLGTVVIESLALGRPLVAPAHGGAAEMIEDNVTGLLFEPRNAVSLAAQILRLHDDPDVGERLGRAARESALRAFAVRHHVEQVQAIYERVLQAPGTRAPLGAAASPSARGN